MPHKRSKRAVREQERSLKGIDLPPGSEDTVPQSVTRILNAEKIRKEFGEKKRKIDERDGDGHSQQERRRQASDDTKGRNEESLMIQPRETMTHFNKRVESSMMPLIRSAMQQSSSRVRRVRKHEMEESVTNPAQGKTAINQSRNKPKEFYMVSTSAPRRLNNIAQEPPQFSRFPRGAQRGKYSSQAKMTGILSMAQRAMMEEERENAIKRYRELKAKRLCHDGSTTG